MTIARRGRVGGPWRWLVAIVVVGGAAALGLPGGEDWLGVAAIIGMIMAAGVVHLVIHEGGHLLAALLTGLPVTRARITVRSGRQSMVMVRPEPSWPALAVRMVVFALGGPLANLGAAALTYQFAVGSFPVLVRYALGVTTLTGIAFGLVNLLPYRLPSGLRSDGLLALRWALHSAGARAELDRGQRAEGRIKAYRAIAGSYLEGIRLNEVTATDDPLILLAWFERRWMAGDHDRIVAEAERLSAIAHDEVTDPAHAGLIAGRLATIFGMSYLFAAIVDDQPVDRTHIDEIVEIGELAARLLPENVHARIGLAIVRLLDHRPEEARDLLAGITSAGIQSDAMAVAVQVRAVAEVYLSDQAQADPLIAAFGDGNPAMRQILTALRASATTGQLPTLSPRPAPA